MKRISLLLIFVTSTFLTFENCADGEEEIPNKAPTCSITSPSNNATIKLGTTTAITVTARDTDGVVVNVKISVDNGNVATLQSSPFTYDWNTAGLDPGEHTIKAVATDDGGLTATAEIDVTISADAPTVTTAEISEITGATATSGGSVANDGGVEVTARGVLWSESSGPTLDVNDGFTEDGTGKGDFISELSGLKAATTYYVKAYASNSQGTAYGEEKTFVTAVLPTVVTGDVSDITYESAMCAGEVTDNGGEMVAARGLVWNASGESAPTPEDNEGITTEGDGLGAFSSTMNSLTHDTRYQVRAYASNSSGTSYGDLKYFSTIPAPPTVSAVTITKIGAHSAYATVEITDDGGANNVDVSVYLSTSPNPDDSNNGPGRANKWSSNGTNFEYNLTGLEPETKYYIRAIAFNNYEGKSFGEEKSFTTLPFSIQTGSFTDSRDNTTYGTVTIGSQTWMSENLTYLPEVCGVNTECGYWVYDYEGTDLSAAKETSNYKTYGVLYNQEMAKSSCPADWHLPSSDEWSLLEISIGMEYNYAYGNLNRKNTTEGDKLKEVGDAHWNDSYPGNTGTNISGFNALPGGYRDVASSNVFQWQGTSGHFWTSTVEGNSSQTVTFRHISGAAIFKSDYFKDTYEKQGMSVRCVKD